ncbi:lytic polysaccharide monooxygenase [Streptomyces sp. A3M-1-3]|uniref:lytic polysaccharide monooxygenase auxiliary activity family 9 protein n=1 Tax=Streptomyces sp. A3M-1-3 TaxID=2962044 RepID=UPI0020B63F63|nr:lytic polysaccharide monooxygenase [Streptomyces sp. A3M-1-3]MCP3822548.1 lytic polysaccharide monooxygenase [Streptomyces sp. A3M-1-3]
MTARRTATGVAALGFAPLALAALAAGPAAAHGAMTDPVSRVSACFAEGPEGPESAACKAAVAASGTQAFYDWNEVNIANAAGNHKSLIPDGKLCSAGRDKYKGLDLARADWPSSKLSSGAHTFRYKATAPHKGSFELYITKDGYDPSKPLKWSDLESEPFATVTNPKLENGAYVFDGTVPGKSGRHLIYSIWQRSDSPEAFYTCSDVVFGKDTGGSGAGGGSGETAPAPTASAPTDEEIEDGTGESGAGTESSAPATETTEETTEEAAGNEPAANGSATPAADGENLAKTGGDSTTSTLAIGGAAALAVGAAVLFASVRRKAVTGGRHTR